jgi:hypothetical protein
MIFDFKGKKYKLRFHYEKQELTREIRVRGDIDIDPGPLRHHIVYDRIPGRQITLLVKETKRRTVCQLLVRHELAGWVQVDQGISRCSLEDRYIRKAGQGKALKKLLDALEGDSVVPVERPFVYVPGLADKIRELWRNRFTRTPAKTRMAANSGSAAQNTKAEERAEAPNTKE